MSEEGARICGVPLLTTNARAQEFLDAHENSDEPLVVVVSWESCPWCSHYMFWDCTRKTTQTALKRLYSDTRDVARMAVFEVPSTPGADSLSIESGVMARQGFIPQFPMLYRRAPGVDQWTRWTSPNAAALWQTHGDLVEWVSSGQEPSGHVECSIPPRVCGLNRHRQDAAFCADATWDCPRRSLSKSLAALVTAVLIAAGAWLVR